MRKFLNKLRLNITLFFHGIFQGLRSADTTMLSQVSGEDGDDQEVSHKLEINSVYNDLLREKKTQEVMETIDMSYRVAREANKYEVTLIGDLGDDSVGSDRELSAVAVKKVAMKYDKHPEVFNERGYHVTLIQDNKKIQKANNFSMTADDLKEAINTNGGDFVTLIDIRYDGFTPRFTLQNFVTKVVVRETKAGKVKLDLYLPTEAGQFTKTDAILIAELHRIMDNNLKKTDFLDIKALSFTTDKAYGAEDYIWYNFAFLKFKKITIFDGSFVLTFEVGATQSVDIVEEHKTESLTKKYEEMAPRKGNLSIENLGAIDRREEKLSKKKPKAE
jgi:hypothetical protein